MNAQRLFAYEFGTAIAITSWGAIRKGYAPWPPNMIYSAIGFMLLSVVSIFDEKLCVTLGAGWLLALIVGESTGGKIADTFAATPPPGYDVLSLSSLGGTANGPAA